MPQHTAAGRKKAAQTDSPCFLRCPGYKHGILDCSFNQGCVFTATVFPGPLCFELTADQTKESATFPFDGEGLDAAIAWLNQKYDEKPEEWKNGEKLL